MAGHHPSPPSSPTVGEILARETFMLEEILGKKHILPQCKISNDRLINFLRRKDQLEKMLRYIVEEPPRNSDLNRLCVYPYISFALLTHNVEKILITIVEEQQLMDLLFSFLEPNRNHRVVLAEYFSKVLLCLIYRKALPFMIYVQGHPDLLRKLVDLIGVSPITEFLVHLLGSDKYYPDRLALMQWLAHGNLLEMIVDKLHGNNALEVQSSAAEILCAVAGKFTSLPALKLSSPRFIETLFSLALRDPTSKSSLVHSLTVCIPLLEPQRAATYSPSLMTCRRRHISGGPNPGIREIICVILPKLGDLRRLLDASGDEENLPTTYGELKPPLGRHRLKIVEFIAVLTTVGGVMVERELVSSGIIHTVIDLFFEYPFNNFLHHHVAIIIALCLHNNNLTVVEHLLRDCNLIGKILRAENNPDRADDVDKPTVSTASRRPPRAGNVGHITSIANLLVRLGSIYGHIQAHLQEHSEWNEWQSRTLRQRNAVENVFSWTFGRPVVDKVDPIKAQQPLDDDGDDNGQQQASDGDDDDDDDDYDDDDYDDNGHQQASDGDDDDDDDYDDDDDDDAEATSPAAAYREDEDAFFDDGSPEAATSSQRLGHNPRKRSLLRNAGGFSHEDDQNWKTTTPPPSNSMEDVHFYGANNEGDNQNRDSPSKTSSAAPIKYSRRIMSRLAAEESSSKIAEASCSGYTIGHDGSMPGNNELFSLHSETSTMETESGDPKEAEASMPGSIPFESDDKDTNQSDALPK